MKKYFYPVLILATGILFNACKKQNDSFSSDSLKDFYPLAVGKYVTYNLDSTIFINFGAKDTVRKYQVQDRVDAQISDNIGRPAFRILRFIRKDATQSWSPNNTFMAVVTDNTVEYVENNLRFQKLKIPFKEGFSWKGNSFIDTYSLNSDVKYLDDWAYTYDSLNAKIKLGNLTVDSTVKVLERDEFLGQDPRIPGTQYAEKNYSVEKYGKGIGLIFREFIHWEYQGGTRSYTGYGVKLIMIDHN